MFAGCSPVYEGLGKAVEEIHAVLREWEVCTPRITEPAHSNRLLGAIYQTSDGVSKHPSSWTQRSVYIVVVDCGKLT